MTIPPAHFCQDGHQPIWHNDSEHELCPLCQLKAEAATLVARWRRDAKIPAGKWTNLDNHTRIAIETAYDWTLEECAKELEAAARL